MTRGGVRQRVAVPAGASVRPRREDSQMIEDSQLTKQSGVRQRAAVPAGGQGVGGLVSPTRVPRS